MPSTCFPDVQNDSKSASNVNVKEKILCNSDNESMSYYKELNGSKLICASSSDLSRTASSDQIYRSKSARSDTACFLSHSSVNVKNRSIASHSSLESLSTHVQASFKAFQESRIKNNTSSLATENLHSSKPLKMDVPRENGIPLSIRRKANFSQGPFEEEFKSLFADYKDVFDTKTGSLTFKNMATIDSDGVNFASGKKFHIRFEDLKILGEIGRGNFGVVRQVFHQPSNMEMAMKEVRLRMDDLTFRQILMELEVLNNAINPNIVDFYGAFCVEGCVFFCIEYMDGGSIYEIYKDGFEEEPLGYIAKCTIEGLKFLKEQLNIIHRDVKPTNILVNTSGCIKICDFGVSGNLVASIARTNIGCQSYYAPERIKSQSSQADDNTYDVRADIWSVGLSLVEMALGQYPYPTENMSSIFAQLSAICDGDPPRLDPKSYSQNACDFTRQCLQKEAAKRPTYPDLVRHPWILGNKFTQADMALLITKRLLKKTDLEPKAKPPLHCFKLSDITK